MCLASRVQFTHIFFCCCFMYIFKAEVVAHPWISWIAATQIFCTKVWQFSQTKEAAGVMYRDDSFKPWEKTICRDRQECLRSSCTSMDLVNHTRAFVMVILCKERCLMQRLSGFTMGAFGLDSLRFVFWACKCFVCFFFLEGHA